MKLPPSTRQAAVTCAILLLVCCRVNSQPATAFQIDRGHTGYTSLETRLILPLKRKWQLDFPGPLSYPLIADGRVFVLMLPPASYTAGPKLIALDEKTGKVLWHRAIPKLYGDEINFYGQTYGDGRVYVLDLRGHMTAVDATTGQKIWAHKPPGPFYSDSAPVFSNGRVYSSSFQGGVAYAVDAATGKTAWETPVIYGYTSSPAVSDSLVYYSYSFQTYALDTATGAVVWHSDRDGAGGGGAAPVFAPGFAVFTRSQELNGAPVLDPWTGALLDEMPNADVPAVEGLHTYSLYKGGALTAYDAVSHTTHWTFWGKAPLGPAPIVVDDLVYIGDSNGNLYALDTATGTVTWQDNVGASFDTSPNEGGFLSGFAAGDGILVVPAGGRLTAYGN